MEDYPTLEELYYGEEEEEEEEATDTGDAGDQSGGQGDGDSDDGNGGEDEDYNPFLDDGIPPAKSKEDDSYDEDDEDVAARERQETRNELKELRIKNDMREFFDTELGEYFKPHKDKIMKVALHPKAEGLSPEAVASMAIGAKAMLKIGQQMGQDRSNNQKKSTTPGRSTGKPSSDKGKKDISKASDADILKMAEEMSRR